MNARIEINADLEEMLCYALRYALGRRSYAPYSVITFLRPLLPYIRDSELAIWRRDILSHFPPEEAEMMQGREAPYAEWEYFCRLWLNFARDIREEEGRRAHDKGRMAEPR